MRTALLIAQIGGKPHVRSGGKWLPADTCAVDKAVGEFKQEVAKAEGIHAELTELSVWVSDSGVTKRAKFITPDEKKRREDVLAKQVEAAKAKAEQPDEKKPAANKPTTKKS